MFIVNWLKGLFAHPKTTVAGIGALAGAAAIGYGMSTGAIPVTTQTVATLGGLASAGVAGIAAKDAVGAVVTNAATTAATLAPTAMSLVDQYKAMQSEANDAQSKLDAFTKVTEAIAAALPSDKSV